MFVCVHVFMLCAVVANTEDILHSIVLYERACAALKIVSLIKDERHDY